MYFTQDSLNELKKNAKKTGKSLLQLYLESKKGSTIKLAKNFPLLYNAVFNKRYILPNYRQNDYISQEACDYLMFDMILAMSLGEADARNRRDEVLNTCYVATVRQIEFGRPTFFLEKELCGPMYKTKLPDTFYLSDINWRFPAFRVYLPKGMVNIERNGKKSSLMFLDITKIDNNEFYDMPKSIREELKKKLGFMRLPPFLNNYNGFGISGNLDFDSDESCIGYAGCSPLDGVTIKKVAETAHEFDLNASLPSDQIDKAFVNRLLMLGINLLLFLSSYPLEYEPKKDLIRAPRQEGKRTISGLYKAKFIGESQMRPYHPSKHHNAVYAPTGQTMAAQWRSGHWKRIWFGPGKQENRLQWIGLYGTHEFVGKDYENEKI